MKKLSDYKDEEALDLLADILEPAVAIMADPGVRDAAKTSNKIKIAKVVIKNHKPEVMEIMATLEGVSVKDFHCNIFTLPAKIMEILNDKELMTVFTSQAQEIGQSISSGPATVNTEDEEE